MRDVRAGFFSFTEITAPGAHRAYNVWHLLDHMPEQFGIAGIALGQRWAHTPEAAAVAVSEPPFDRVHYMTLYLMTEPLDATLDEFAALGRELHDTPGRWFDPRRAHVAGPWSVHATAAAPRVRVRAEVIPARPHRAIAIRAGEHLDGADELDALCARDGVAGAWSFAPEASLAHRRRGGSEVAITIAWIDELPAPAIGRTGDVLATWCTTIVPWDVLDA